MQTPDVPPFDWTGLFWFVMLAPMTLPWIALANSRRAGAITAVVTSSAATVWFAVIEMSTTSRGNIPLDLLLVPLLVVAWLHVAAFVAVARRSASPLDRNARLGLSFLGAFVVLVVAVTLLVLSAFAGDGLGTGGGVIGLVMMPFEFIFERPFAALIPAAAFAAAAVASRVYEDTLSRHTVVLGAIALAWTAVISLELSVVQNGLESLGDTPAVFVGMLLYWAATITGAVVAFSRARRGAATKAPGQFDR